jgi:O-antigen ligase
LVLALVALGPYPEAPFVFMVPGIDIQAYPSARFLVWQDTIESIRNSLLLGTGPGNPVCYVTFTNTDGTMSLLTDAHNSFLSVLGERGILGAIAFIITLAIIIRPRSLFKRSNTSYPPQLVSYGLRFALAIGFVYQGMVGSFEDAKHLWVLMGLALAANEICVSEEKYKKSNEPAAI